MHAQEVVHFWRDAGPQRWFEKSQAFDDMCELGFEEACEQAANGEFDHWATTAEGALALVLLLDQLPRNIHRRTRQAYSADDKALQIASEAIEQGFDEQVDEELRQFFYTPFMHSESMADQDRAVELYEALNGTGSAKWALHHRAIIERFGRFPHRNAILGRDSTAEEEAWLQEGGFSG